MAAVRPSFVLALLGALGVYLMARSKLPDGRRVVDAAIDSVAASFGSIRGLRNNNPGNIDRRAGTTWRGASADQSGDSRFVVFDAPEWGVRAMARVLKTYMGRGVDSVRGIINTWAPPSENDTGAYVASVAGSLGVSPDAALDEASLPALIAAIIQHENGVQPYSWDVIARGVALEKTA